MPFKKRGANPRARQGPVVAAEAWNRLAFAAADAVHKATDGTRKARRNWKALWESCKDDAQARLKVDHKYCDTVWAHHLGWKDAQLEFVTAIQSSHRYSRMNIYDKSTEVCYVVAVHGLVSFPTGAAAAAVQIEFQITVLWSLTKLVQQHKLAQETITEYACVHQLQDSPVVTSDR